MKFEKNKVYEGIFLSDVHYLLNKKIKSHKHKELFQFLDHLKKEKRSFQEHLSRGRYRGKLVLQRRPQTQKK